MSVILQIILGISLPTFACFLAYKLGYTRGYTRGFSASTKLWAEKLAKGSDGTVSIEPEEEVNGG